MQKVKVVFVGNSGVGKTALFHRFEKNEFCRDISSTIGGACTNVNVDLDTNEQVPLIVWDTAGQESFRAIVPMYFSRAAFILIVYDVSSMVSFQAVKDWYNLSKEKAPENAKIIFIGNKSDLEKREVSYQDLDQLASELDTFLHTETSAITGSGIHDLLTSIAVSAKNDELICPDGKEDEKKELKENEHPQKECC